MASIFRRSSMRVAQDLDPHVGDIKARGREEVTWYGRHAAWLYKDFTTGWLRGHCRGPHNMGASVHRGGDRRVGDVGVDVIGVSNHASGEGTASGVTDGQNLRLQALEHRLDAQAKEHHGQGTPLANSCLALPNEHPRGEVEL